MGGGKRSEKKGGKRGKKQKRYHVPVYQWLGSRTCPGQKEKKGERKRWARKGGKKKQPARLTKKIGGQGAQNAFTSNWRVKPRNGRGGGSYQTLHLSWSTPTRGSPSGLTCSGRSERDKWTRVRLKQMQSFLKKKKKKHNGGWQKKTRGSLTSNPKLSGFRKGLNKGHGLKNWKEGDTRRKKRKQTLKGAPSVEEEYGRNARGNLHG